MDWATQHADRFGTVLPAAMRALTGSLQKLQPLLTAREFSEALEDAIALTARRAVYLKGVVDALRLPPRYPQPDCAAHVDDALGHFEAAAIALTTAASRFDRPEPALDRYEDALKEAETHMVEGDAAMQRVAATAGD